MRPSAVCGLEARRGGLSSNDVLQDAFQSYVRLIQGVEHLARHLFDGRKEEGKGRECLVKVHVGIATAKA